MKKAFEQNVSRARPRLRLGALMTEAVPAAEAPEPAVAHVAPEQIAPVEETPKAKLGAAVKARAEAAREPRPTAAEAMKKAIEVQDDAKVAVAAVYSELQNGRATPAVHEEMPMAQVHVEQVQARVAEAAPITAALAAMVSAPAPASTPAAVAVAVAAPVAHMEPPRHAVEVQTPAPELPHREMAEPAPDVRRERLKERLKAIRENPRPEPLPPTVAEAGMLAVERIATLQAELTKVKALNLALSQDLEGARRQAEKATEEARLRMDESRRLSTEMEARGRLLSELERELSALEGERDDSLLALQESRQALDAAAKEKDELAQEIAKRDQALAESLSEEERLCAELEHSREDSASLRRSVETLSSERDTLARQVSELTAERSELLEARKALEAVHRALSHAAAR